MVAIVVARSPASSASTWRWNNATMASCSADRVVIGPPGFVLRITSLATSSQLIRPASMIGNTAQQSHPRYGMARRCAEEIRMAHEHKPADVYPALLKAFNSGDVDATVACYESEACFVLKSGHAA